MSNSQLLSLLDSVESELGFLVQRAIRDDFQRGTSTFVELMNFQFAVIKQNGKIRKALRRGSQTQS
jgi:hypothetical protein